MIDLATFRHDVLVLAEKKFEGSTLRERILEQVNCALNQYQGSDILLDGGRELIANAEEAAIDAKVRRAVQDFFWEVCEPRGIEIRILE